MHIRLKSMVAGLAVVLATVAACGPAADKQQDHGDQAGEYEKGPHGGRLLRDGDFALEVTIHESGVPPHFRFYAYADGKPLAPSSVTASAALARLGGDVDRFSFRPEGDYLVGDGIVREPHSFDVSVDARHEGKRHAWRYDSYEGRTTIAAASAAQAGVATEKAGPASMPATIELIGRLDFAPGAEASVKARFPGRILSLSKNVGDTVRAGETLARVESNESLQSYPVAAPIGGVVVERPANPGDIAGDEPLFELGDPNRLVADFHVYDRDMAKVRPRQPVDVMPVNGGDQVRAAIEGVLPVREALSQTSIARVRLPAGQGWMPGMTVRGLVTVDVAQVPLAVRTSALQRFRDFEVVFAKVGDTYEVRMLEIGRRTKEWAEVLGGLKPGEEYVTANSFLIKADIEKSGASHDH
ncbi:HlyD family efflux transporter periplasmic adaptor subunit [Emcibacter sp. SYSU 3D8]|uniref:efflux RND transporter periplasmic adaptor subunit n=1 Tax=Emcibacter sp. SYSU 3D8 TaxID=3133969 RepID=UPI0031FEB6E4